ncbi:MAG: hypothetical protein LAT67_05165 [Balneolales bacterium]|nr:hypothetical protein [Balneolales bacterium]
MSTNNIHTSDSFCTSRAFILLAITNVVAFLLSFVVAAYFPTYWDIAEGLFKCSIILLIFLFTDKYILTGIYSKSELKRGNIAYAIFVFALLYVFAQSFSIF